MSDPKDTPPTLTKYFAWREMNGCHFEYPKEAGPYYDSDDSLACTFDTREEAEAAYIKFAKRHRWVAPSALVLIEIYRIDVSDCTP